MDVVEGGKLRVPAAMADGFAPNGGAESASGQPARRTVGERGRLAMTMFALKED